MAYYCVFSSYRGENLLRCGAQEHQIQLPCQFRDINQMIEAQTCKVVVLLWYRPVWRRIGRSEQQNHHHNDDDDQS